MQLKETRHTDSNLSTCKILCLTQR